MQNKITIGIDFKTWNRNITGAVMDKWIDRFDVFILRDKRSWYG